MGRAVRAVAIATSVLAASCVGARPGPGAPDLPVSPSAFAALWPEQSLDGLLRTQAEVDAGPSALAWRRDPAETARRFASRVLGWDDASVVKDEAWRLSSGVPIARVWLCRSQGCPPGGAAFDQEVILKRLARADGEGVWSVTDVTSGRILLTDGPAIRIRDPFVRAGKRLEAFTPDLPDGTRVLAGSATFGPCGAALDATTPTFRFSHIRFQVATALGAGCSKVTRPSGPTPGYVFVLPRSRGMSADPLTLFTRPRPQGSDPIPDLTAIAVRFSPRAELPSPPAPWLSRDPDTLPDCGDRQLGLGPISAGQAVSQFGVAIRVGLSRRHVAACHARLFLHLSLYDRDGAPIAVQGRHRLTVDAFLPGYVPDPRSLSVGWALMDWCGRSVPGPVVLRVRGAGRTLIAVSEQLSLWCPPSPRGSAEVPRLRALPG